MHPTIDRVPNMRLTGAEAQYAMRYLRVLAGRRATFPPAALVARADTSRRAKIEAFVDALVAEARP